MRRLLNTLFVTTDGAYLAREGESVVVRHEQQERLRVPMHTLGGIVCFGRVACSPFLLGFCGEQGVALTHLSANGRFLARLEGPVSGNVLLRRRQYRMADESKGAAGIARAVLAAKVANARTVLLRGARDSQKHESGLRLRSAANALARQIQRLEDAAELPRLRGIEGDSAKLYFSAFNDLITTQKEAFSFSGRSRRPPLDNINALLSLLYTLLVHDVSAALQSVGLDPAVGFLHSDRPGRPSLALDLVEELRPVLADRLALTLVNRRQLGPADFYRTESGGVVLRDDPRKQLLIAYQKRKQEELRHPFTGEKIAFGLLPHVQALLLARHLRGDMDAYPAFFWK